VRPGQALQVLQGLVLLGLVLRLLFLETRPDPGLQGIRSALEGFRPVAPGSTIVIRETVDAIPNVDPLDRLFRTEDWRRMVAAQEALSASLREVQERLDLELVATTDVEARTAADTVWVPIGGEVHHPAGDLEVQGLGQYRLTFHPRRVRASLVETDRGTLLEVWDLTLDRPMTVERFDQARRDPRWRWRWFQWSVGAGLATRGDGLAPSVTGSVAPVGFLTPGGNRWEFLTVWATPYGGGVDLVRFGR